MSGELNDEGLLQEALADRRIARVLHIALRDASLRVRFAALREDGRTVEKAVEELRGPHLDTVGRPYYLSDERVRSIVYQKG